MLIVYAVIIDDFDDAIVDDFDDNAEYEWGRRSVNVAEHAWLPTY